MTSATLGGRYGFAGTGLTVNRMGYGAMRLSGPHIMGPPRNPEAAAQVLRDAIAAGIDHIDTSDFYGPHTVNQLIRATLAPYPAGLVLVSKLGARRTPEGDWLPWNTPDDLSRGLEDNLANLGRDRIDVVNFRLFDADQPIEAGLDRLARHRDEGILGAIGISNATPDQVWRAQKQVGIACVQNQYNIALRGDDALIDELAAEGIPYVPFFPLGGFSPLQSAGVDAVAADLGATAMQVALAWLLQRAPNILLIPGTSSPAHLAENIAAASLQLPPEALARLNAL
jgi:aryl-alcohol dehydrogenase-like predicted oxidoreductase